MSGGRLYVANGCLHHQVTRRQGDDIKGAEEIAVGLREAQAVAEDVGGQVVAGSITAQGGCRRR